MREAHSHCRASSAQPARPCRRHAAPGCSRPAVPRFTLACSRPALPVSTAPQATAATARWKTSCRTSWPTVHTLTRRARDGVHHAGAGALPRSAFHAPFEAQPPGLHPSQAQPGCGGQPQPLALQVLAQVANYRPPTAATTGRYTLKRDCWREFDPFFPHFTRWAGSCAALLPLPPAGRLTAPVVCLNPSTNLCIL